MEKEKNGKKETNKYTYIQNQKIRKEVPNKNRTTKT